MTLPAVERLAFHAKCQAPGCGVQAEWVPGTQSAIDADNVLLAHLRANPDSAHRLGPVAPFFTTAPQVAAMASQDVEFHQVFKCQACDWSLDAGADVSDAEAALVEIHRAMAGHAKVIVQAKWRPRT